MGDVAARSPCQWPIGLSYTPGVWTEPGIHGVQELVEGLAEGESDIRGSAEAIPKVAVYVRFGDSGFNHPASLLEFVWVQKRVPGMFENPNCFSHYPRCVSNRPTSPRVDLGG